MRKIISNHPRLFLLIIVQFILIVCCITFPLLFDPIVKLNENQILYFFSTAAQVIAGLYGLTMAGYIFLSERLNSTVIDDDSLYDAVEGLKKQYYLMILAMGILAILGIILSLINLCTYEVLSNYPQLYSFMLNEAVVIIVTEIILIVIFSWKVIDPNKISKMSLLLKIENEYDTDSYEEGDLADFLKYYNLLEQHLLSYTNDIIGLDKDYREVRTKFKKEYRPSIFQALKILNSRGIISKELLRDINELRQYRNSVVHGTEMELKVSVEACKKIKEIYDFVKTSFG